MRLLGLQTEILPWHSLIYLQTEKKTISQIDTSSAVIIKTSGLHFTDNNPATSDSLIVNGPVTYYLSLYVEDGEKSYAYSAINLPSWLTLNATTGKITGTPASTASAITVSVSITDSEGTQFTADFRIGKVIDKEILSSIKGKCTQRW